MLNKKKDDLLKDDCLFCKIIKGEIPCYKIYEDENSLAFLDIAEDYYGHTLIIPKNHCTNLYDADSNQILSVMQTVQKIIKHYKQLIIKNLLMIYLIKFRRWLNANNRI